MVLVSCRVSSYPFIDSDAGALKQSACGQLAAKTVHLRRNSLRADVSA
jgi:hypothetical protein